MSERIPGWRFASLLLCILLLSPAAAAAPPDGGARGSASPPVAHLPDPEAEGTRAEPAPAGALTEADAIARALAHSPTLRAAVADLERTRAGVAGEEGRYRPSLKLDTGYTHSESPSLNADGVLVGKRDALTISGDVSNQFAGGTTLGGTLALSGSGQQYAAPNLPSAVDIGPGYGVDLTVSVTQPILRGAGLDVGEAALRRAMADRTAAESARERTASEVLQEALSAWWELWYARAAVVIREEARSVNERQLAEARAKVAAGTLAPLEVLPLQTELASSDEALLAARADAATRAVTLERALGLSPAGTTVVGGARPDEPPAPPRAEVAAMAVDTSWELRELRASIDRAQQDIAVADDATSPRLDAQAWLTFSGLGNRDVGAAFEQLGTAGAVSAFVGLSGTFPLDGTLLDSQAAQARLAVAAATDRTQAAKERIEAQAVDLVDKIAAARQRMALAAQTAAFAEQSAQGRQAAFDAGTSTSLDLVLAQQQQREAQLREKRARADLATLRIALDHATATLLARAAP